MQKIFLITALLTSAAYAEELPAWFIPLRDAIYDQVLNANDVNSIGERVIKTANEELSGADLDVMLARCEYIIGRAYQFDEIKHIAILRFEKGMALAKKAAVTKPSSGAYQMIALNTAQACMLKPVSWVMANGLDVEKYSKKALSLDKKNGAAQYTISSRWVYGPGIFGDPTRGIREMTALLNSDASLQKDDMFNIYSALGYGYARLKKNENALIWFEKALAEYPTNKYVQDEIKKLK